MFEVIVVPLDGSELAEQALAPALEIRSKFGSKLILVRAVESLAQHMLQAPVIVEQPAAAAATVELMEEIVETERDEATKYLQGLLAKAGEGVEAAIVEGDPAEAVTKLAEERGARLIVMSSHGRGGLGRLVFGSVADAILRHSDVPVMLIRSKED